MYLLKCFSSEKNIQVIYSGNHTIEFFGFYLWVFLLSLARPLCYNVFSYVLLCVSVLRFSVYKKLLKMTVSVEKFPE